MIALAYIKKLMYCQYVFAIFFIIDLGLQYTPTANVWGNSMTTWSLNLNCD